jgi:hypothetical protein
MADLSDFAEEKLVKNLVGDTDWAGPSNTYVALFTSDPGESGESGEVSASEYSRQSVTWTANGTDTMENSAEIQFPEATSSWGTVSHFGIYDGSATDGSTNQLFSGALDTSQSVDSGVTAIIQAGDLSITLA